MIEDASEQLTARAMIDWRRTFGISQSQAEAKLKNKPMLNGLGCDRG